MIHPDDAAKMKGVTLRPSDAPEHDDAVREMTADNIASLEEMAAHLARTGWPGFGERATRAANRLGSVTQSYLDACADNDRLRAEAARLRAAIEALRPHLAALPPGPWETWTSCSFRRISGPDGVDGGVLCGTIQRSDGHPDLSWTERECEAICAVVNGIRRILNTETDHG